MKGRRAQGPRNERTRKRVAARGRPRPADRLDLVMHAINEGVYDWDIGTGKVDYSERVTSIVGLSRAQLRTAADWYGRIHPDDLARYDAALVGHFKGRAERFECDYRFRAADGSWRWARTHGIAQRDTRGRAVRMIGSTGDITELKRAEIELRRARDEAHEALERQTASSEILRAIAGVRTDPAAVFNAIARNAARLCGALFCNVLRYDGDMLHVAAAHGFDPEFRKRVDANYPMRPAATQLSGRVIQESGIVRIADATVDERYDRGYAKEGGWRRMLGVPMMHDGMPLGVIVVAWRDAGETPDTQVDLLQSFADQAVIAIENVRLFNETREALERQTATSEILTSISSSIADTRPVFDAVVRNLLRLFGTRFAALFLRNGDRIEIGALQGEPGFERLRDEYPRPLDESTSGGRVILSGRALQFTPMLGNPDVPPGSAEIARKFGFNSLLSAPLVREGNVIGYVTTAHREARPFDAKQVALIKTFADQAVIAIENSRLFNETREALERQTATAEILQVISGSPTDTQPVFDAIVRSGLRLFHGAAVAVALPDGDQVRFAAIADPDPEQVKAWKSRFPFPLTREYMHGVVILDGRLIDVPDARIAPPGLEAGCANFLATGYRAATMIPMLRGGRAIGAVSVLRIAPGPLTDRQLSVLKTFADQAVIAIENVRLFNELDARNRELSEALEQQRASSEVLQAISSSIADTKPVFDKILESCEHLFAGKIVGVNLVGEDGQIHMGAYHGPGRDELAKVFPLSIDRNSGSGRAIVEGRAMNYADTEDEREVPAATRRGCAAIGIKSVIFAPMLWKGDGMGAIFVGREHKGRFSEGEVALLRTFADQAVIAVQNARLFREIEVANRHKSEFLASMSHELRTPLNAIIGFTRIVHRNAQGRLEPRQVENLEKIQASGEHLLALINAVLDLSKVEAGRVEVSAREVELIPVLENCLRTVEPLVKADSVALERDFDAAMPTMLVDDEKLRQIVINLLSNAAKFTERGSIRLSARAGNGGVRISVADTGIGIAADKQGLIFEEFRQADAGSTREYGGTGLGLAIARRLARLMGGDITVASELGSGSTFTLTLPLRYSA